MKKLLTFIIVLIILMSIVFIAGYRIALRATLVTVTIRNNASLTIGSARVEHEQGTVVAADIKRNRTARIPFYSKGKNRYKLSVVFENNRTLYSADRQVKPGDRLQESVTDSVITALE